MAIVGANVWKGGYQQYSMSTRRRVSSYEPNIEPDSYLGKNVNVKGISFTCTALM